MILGFIACVHLTVDKGRNYSGR